MKYIFEFDSDLTDLIILSSPDSSLPVGTTVGPLSDQYKFGDASYKFQKTKLKWDEAQRMCKQLDYTLTSILEAYTASFLRVQLDRFKEPFWIGLYSNNKVSMKCCEYTQKLLQK